MGALGRLYRNETAVDFTRVWPRMLIVSAVAVAVCVVSLLVRPLALGIDFEGGTSWEVPGVELDVGEVRDALRPYGQEGARIQTIGGDTIRVQSGTDDAEVAEEVRVALAELGGIEPTDVAVTTVGPSWGDEITSAALRALVWFFAAIALYMTVRLEWKMAVGGLVAVFHDIIITVGVYSIFQFDVTPATVIAFLTILGYSLYDTIVVFDQIRDNSVKVGASNRLTYAAMASLSVNQVMMRSLNTTITSVLPILSMLVIGSVALGAVTLQEFAIALLIGLLTGAYSSLFVATPIVVWLKEREEPNRQIRRRLASVDTHAAVTAARTGERAPDVPDGEPSAVDVAEGEGAKPATWSGNHPPRPRKNRRR
ncbi:MAG: protein translocase subunit SecF [Actinomycetota bacterium]|nr:protein translocase subunit SecF [Actinomycetota bacterium]